MIKVWLFRVSHWVNSTKTTKPLPTPSQANIRSEKEELSFMFTQTHPSHNRHLCLIDLIFCLIRFVNPVEVSHPKYPTRDLKGVRILLIWDSQSTNGEKIPTITTHWETNQADALWPRHSHFHFFLYPEFVFDTFGCTHIMVQWFNWISIEFVGTKLYKFMIGPNESRILN